MVDRVANREVDITAALIETWNSLMVLSITLSMKQHIWNRFQFWKKCPVKNWHLLILIQVSQHEPNWLSTGVQVVNAISSNSASQSLCCFMWAVSTASKLWYTCRCVFLRVIGGRMLVLYSYNKISPFQTACSWKKRCYQWCAVQRSHIDSA